MILKDIRLLLRSRTELVIVLVMPLVITSILGFALAGLDGGGEAPPLLLELHATLVVEDDEAEGLARFRAALAASDLGPLQRAGLQAAATQLRPQQLLREVLAAEELAELLSLEEAGSAQAMAALDAGRTQAVIVLPAGFSGDLLQRMLLEQGDGAELRMATSARTPLAASVIQGVVDGFVRELNFRTALAQLGQPVEAVAPAPVAIERLSSAQPVSLVTYYAIGMAAMFALYTAGAMTNRAGRERQNQAFARIVVSGVPPLSYLVGKFVSTALVAFVQLMFLLSVSNLLTGSFGGRPPAFWWSVSLVMALLALAIGGLAVFLTGLSFRGGSRSGSEAYAYAVAPMMLLSLFGGGFFPLDGVMAQIGAWVPNGAATFALLKVTQGQAMAAWLPDLLRLSAGGAVLIGLGLWLFPRRPEVGA